MVSYKIPSLLASTSSSLAKSWCCKELLCFCLFVLLMEERFQVFWFCSSLLSQGTLYFPTFSYSPFHYQISKGHFLPLFISDCTPIKLYLQRQVADCFWPVSWRLLTLRNCYVLMEDWDLLPARSYLPTRDPIKQGSQLQIKASSFTKI